jgi:hypothetical protein
MTAQNHFDNARRGTRFRFVSRVRYVVHADARGREYEGLAFNVSTHGICLAVDRRLEVGEEIVITRCLLPYCRRRYKVRWIETTDSVTYKVGLSREVVALGSLRVARTLSEGS